MIFDGEMNITYYLAVYSQSIAKYQTITTYGTYFNELTDTNLDYYVSIPLTFNICPSGNIYMLFEDK